MSARLMSSHMSARLMSSHLFSLFLHLLSSSHISSAELSFCQLVSPHLRSSQRTLKSSQLLSGPNLLQKRISAPNQATPALSTEKILHREACTLAQRILYTQKLLHRDREAFTHSKLLHSKLLHRASFYTETFT